MEQLGPGEFWHYLQLLGFPWENASSSLACKSLGAKGTVYWLSHCPDSVPEQHLPGVRHTGDPDQPCHL